MFWTITFVRCVAGTNRRCTHPRIPHPLKFLCQPQIGYCRVETQGNIRFDIMTRSMLTANNRDTGRVDSWPVTPCTHNQRSGTETGTCPANLWTCTLDIVQHRYASTSTGMVESHGKGAGDETADHHANKKVLHVYASHVYSSINIYTCTYSVATTRVPVPVLKLLLLNDIIL